MPTKERVYTEAEISEKLAKELPEWRFEGGWIRRTYKTHTWPGTILLIGTIGMLSEAAWHHPDLVVSYAFVEVKLSTHSAKGITDKASSLRISSRRRCSGVAKTPRRRRSRSASCAGQARSMRDGERRRANRKARREAGLSAGPAVGDDQYLASTGTGAAQLK